MDLYLYNFHLKLANSSNVTGSMIIFATCLMMISKRVATGSWIRAKF